MKKPTLSDFNLTERDLQTYEVQKKNWMNCFGKICRAKERNHKITVTVGVLSFVIFCVLSFALQEPIFLIPTILIPAITGIFFYIPDYAISKWDKIKENIFFNTLPYDTDKYHYIDKSLEESITCYNRSLSNYEEYLKRVNETFWISMSGYQFENEIADLFRKLGYNIHITPKSGDGGVDIILEKDGKRIAVQCKHHSKPVGPAPVRELMGVVASQDFDSGIFISLNGYTKNAISEANLSKVQISLLSLYDILELLKEQEPDFSSTDMHTNSYHESDEEETIDVNISTYGEFIESGLNKKNRNLFFSWEDKYHEILEYIKDIPPIEYHQEMDDEDNGASLGGKTEYYIYIDYTYVVHTPGFFLEREDEDYVRVEYHDQGTRLYYFFEKYNIPYDKIDHLKGLSNDELIDRMNLILKCLDKYPQYNLDPTYWIFKSQNDLKQYINTYTDTQKTSLESTSAKHCIDNCSTCNRDTCILDNSE